MRNSCCVPLPGRSSLYVSSRRADETLMRPGLVRALAIVPVLCLLQMASWPRPVAAQAASDLFLVPLHRAGGRMVADSVRRLTDRDGYDNQPSFTPDGRAILYTSIDSAGQADIHRFDLASGRDSRLTRTAPESEYSAAVMPDGDRFAVIRVERDSTQRLWSFRLDGTDPQVVLENVKPAGYFAFLDADRIVLFVLGNPATLQIAGRRDGSARVLASNIGRAVQKVPGRNAVSFLHRDEGPPGWITIWDATSGETTRLVEAFPENEYHAWTPVGDLITARGSTLYRYRPGTDSDWVELAELTASGIRGISRLAVSPDGSQLVLVANH
jgi:dipeptidyl aminopeptidase/acylaminoacyl peptidase